MFFACTSPKKIAFILFWIITNKRVKLLSPPTIKKEKLNPLVNPEAKSWVKTVRRSIFCISNNLFSDFWIAAKTLFPLLRKKWIFSVNPSPLLPTPAVSRILPPLSPRGRDISDWLKATHVWVKPLRRLLFRREILLFHSKSFFEEPTSFFREKPE